MKSAVNILKSLHRKGIDANTPYKGIVVDNNDPYKQARVQVRVPVIHDGIDDELLPWAIPEDNAHSRGLVGGDIGRSAALLGIPNKQSYVSVYFRHDGDPNLASYSHKIPLTADTLPEEFLTNYPDMRGEVFANGGFILFNDRTNEAFFNFPGDTHYTIFGDVFQTVVGNQQVKVVKSKSSIDSYYSTSISSLLNALSSDQRKRVKFSGLGENDSGNLHFEVEGDMSATVNGSMYSKVSGSVQHRIEGDLDYDVDGSVSINGIRIDLN